MIRSTTTMSRRAAALAMLALLASPAAIWAAPSGQPIRIGSTLALTGPLAPTALLHKIAGEIYVEELNRGNGLLGRPVEWVLLDDQSKPDLTRSLYEKLITVDKVDLLIGPYATSGILAAMGVAQRYQKLYIHHSFGMPHLAKYEMHFPTAAFGPEPNSTVPSMVFDGLASTAKPAQDGGHRHQQVPLGAVPVGRGEARWRRSAGSRSCSTSSTSSARATSARSPRG